VRGVLVFVSVLLVAAAGAAPAGGERQADLLVRHGESIGKVKLGMTLAQVRRMLGPERAMNKREKRGKRAWRAKTVFTTPDRRDAGRTEC
jgi:hypothetical protein